MISSDWQIVMRPDQFVESPPLSPPEPPGEADQRDGVEDVTVTKSIEDVFRRAINDD